jgi:hypothetical protein
MAATRRHFLRTVGATALQFWLAPRFIVASDMEFSGNATGQITQVYAAMGGGGGS